MNYVVLTLFKDMVENAMNTSIMGRAIDKGLISLNVIDIRDFACNKHNRVDDYPYGGGAGMVMQAEPVYRACEAARNLVLKMNETEKSDEEQKLAEEQKSDEEQKPAEEQKSAEKQKSAEEQKAIIDQRLDEVRSVDENQGTDKVQREIKPHARLIYLSPIGRTFNQEIAKELAKEENLIFLCGHYEGIDERVLEMEVDDYISLGDFVLTGGELPAICMMDAIARLIPGVLNNGDSASDESFEGNTLEYPQYTRPEEFMGRRVPEVLLSGHHARIKQWRAEQSLKRTMERRPDLLEKSSLKEKNSNPN